MQTIVKNFSWSKATSLAHALEQLAIQPGLQPFAGGTDIMVEVEAGLKKSGHFLDINDLRELRYLACSEDALEIGALSTYTDLMHNSTVQTEFPLLVRAAEETAAPAIQNRGTLGGNIVNASPAADTPPVLLAYDATVVLESHRGRRSVPYDLFHKGYKQFDKGPDELLVAVHLPRPRQKKHAWYHKVGTRRMQAISKVVFAGVLDQEGSVFSGVRLAFGSVAAMPVRALAAEKYLTGKSITEVDAEHLAQELAKTVKPIDDVRSEASYRRQVALNLVLEFIKAR